MTPDRRSGIVFGMPEDEYHAGPEISKTGLWELWSKTPFHFRYGERNPTPSMAFGTAAHCAILEPDAFHQRYERGPEDRRGNRWKEASELASSEGRILLVADEFDRAIEMRDAVFRQLPNAQRALANGSRSEVSVFWTDEKTGEPCRSRVDLYNEKARILFDLKTTCDASVDGFAKSAHQLGYHLQAAMYAEGWSNVTGEHCPFVFLVVENKPPYAAAIREVEPVALEIGARIFREALDRYHECRTNDTWPAWGSDVRSFALPRWAYSADEWERVRENEGVLV